MISSESPSGRLLLASLERKLPKQTFDTWFRPLTIDASATECVFRFSDPNPVVKDWVVAHYGDLILQSLRDLALEEYQIEWSLSRSGMIPAADSSVGTARPTSRAILGEPATASEEGDQIATIVESIPSTLNERYTFPNFVVASCNRF